MELLAVAVDMSLLLALSLFTLVGGVLDTDVESMHRRVEDRLNERLHAGVLAVIAIGLALLWLSDVVQASLTGATPAIVTEFGPRGLRTIVIDLGLVVPPILAVAFAVTFLRAIPAGTESVEP